MSQTLYKLWEKNVSLKYYKYKGLPQGNVAINKQRGIEKIKWSHILKPFAFA